MKKITSRAIICIILALLLFLGTSLFVFKFVKSGGDWAAFPSNKHLYTDGTLNCGRILDSEGVVLAEYDEGWKFNKNSSVRRGTLHSVGDPAGVIGTGALSVFADKLTGYNMFTGSKTLFDGGRDVYLTIDSELCTQAWKALGSHNGAISVYNYKTGEIICMVSSPTYDLKHGIDVDNAPDGVFQNNVTNGLYTPGSVFKLVTATAALEQIKGIESMTFECDGTTELDGAIVTCPYAHGTMNLEQALNKSCNGVFGQLAIKLGAKTMHDYVESTGLTSNYSINGITTKASVFDFDYEGNSGLAWGGVGQGKDMVNPASMMIFAGAIANEGDAALPQILKYTAFHEGARTSLYIRHYTRNLINSETASTLKEMMRTDVINNYGQNNFPGLEICAKSGTAQTDGKADTAWFVGFLDDAQHPLAFSVTVEGGGSGASTAGRIANQILQTAVSKGY